MLFCFSFGIGGLNHNCALAYVDLGSNRGDSLKNFAQGRPDHHVKRALQTAMIGWAPGASCVYAFEPNPRWTSTLFEVQQRIRNNVSSIKVHTETAVVDDNRTSVQLFLDPSPLSEGTSIAHGKGRESAFVRAINFHEWLTRKFASGPVPLVIRMDIEGFEYSLLRSLLIHGTATLSAPCHTHCY